MSTITRRKDLSNSASYFKYEAARQNADDLSKMSTHTRYVLFVISAVIGAISLFATAVYATLAFTSDFAKWETHFVVLALVTITSAAMASRIAAPLRGNLIIFDLFRALRGENLSLDQILGMAYDYTDIEKKHESIPQLIKEQERLTAENEKLARQLADRKTHLANIDNRIAIDLAYDACRCEVDPADIIGQLDQYALEANSAREALRAFNAAGDKDSLVPYCCKAADGRMRPILASWFDFEDEETGEIQRGVVFYDTRGRSISRKDLMSADADDWRLIQGKWVYCSPDNPFTGYAKGDPYDIDALGRPRRYHDSSRIDIGDPLKLWLDNGIAAASEQDFNYTVIHKRLVDDWQEKNKRFHDTMEANSTPNLSLPTTTDQE